ncbi:heat stress transcription factor B-4-like protein [Tanacetum coccineum]|uniref:Heat stress transcription factor B-4-like protein n=1 Tax=Tanacetum coccineum TaxID=301880 RepID=A0ABQ4YNR9_9ASTR
MYVSGRVNIFDMVDIDLFTVVALNMMVLKLGYTCESEPMFYNYLRPLTSLDVELYALACEEDVRCLATLVRSFKLIKVYIEHGVIILDSYLRAPWFRATLEDNTDELAGSIATNRTEKMLLLTWHESSETTKEPDCILTPPTDESVIDDVMRQLSFDKTKLDGEAGFAEVAGSGVDSSGLSHDESFRVDVGPTQEPILAKVSTQEPVVAEVSTQEPIVVEVSTEAPIVEEVETQEFSVEDVVIEDYVSSGEDMEDAEQGTDDDDDVDEDFFMDLPFDNIGITNLVPNDVLKGEDVDVINVDGFDSDPGNDEERNYRKRSPKVAKDRVYLHSIESRRNLKLYKNDSVRIRARYEGKVPVFTMLQGTGPTGPYSGMKAGPSGSSGPTTRVNPDIPVKLVQDQLQRELEYSMLRDYVVELQSTNPNTTVKIAVERNTDSSLPTRVFQRIYVCLEALKLGFRACKRDMLGLDGAFMKGPFPGQVLVAVGLDLNNGMYPLAYALVGAKTKSSWCWFLQCLGDDIDMHPNSNFAFISDRQKGIIPAIKTVYLSAEHRYCLRHIHENMKQGWCGQAYKDLLWRAASTTNVKDFEKCMLELKTMNPKAHEWLNKIPAEHWARSHFSGRAKSDLLLNNICEVFNGKIVGCRDKPVITLLEYIREYCMKRIVNVQGVIDKCTGPLTSTTTRIMESIKKEAHLMKVQWNGANKYQVLGSLDDQCVVDVVSGKNAEGSGSASRQAQQTEPTVGQDGSGGSGAGTVIGLSVAASEGGVGDPCGAGVDSQGSSHTRWTKRRVQTERISPQKRTPTQPASQPSTSSQVPVSQIRNGDGREMGNDVPTQSSAAGGASEWSFL